MNYLYITDDNDKILNKAKQYAYENNLSFYSFSADKESITNVLYLYKTSDNLVIFLTGLNKSPVFDALLKKLEETKKNIVMFATTNTYDIKDALQARFVVVYYDNKDIEKEVKEFIKTGKASKEIYSSISFYICLGKYTTDLKTLLLINAILKQIKKCTYNIPWDYYFNVLKEGV